MNVTGRTCVRTLVENVPC